MLGPAREDLIVLTMEEAILTRDSYDICILDEADECILHHGSVFDQQSS